MKAATLLLSVIVVAVIPSISWAVDCTNYSSMLDPCTPYTCTYTHPMTGEQIEKKIIGQTGGKCLTVEQMPGGGRMECSYTVEMRKAVSQFMASSAGKEGSVAATTSMDGKTKTTYTVDGKQVANPLQTSIENGQCKVAGY